MVSTTAAVARFGGDGLRRRRGSFPSRTRLPPDTGPPRRRRSVTRPSPSSVSAARRSSCPGSTATGPGAIPHTRTWGARPRAKTRVSIAWAALAAEWSERGPRPVRRDVLDHDDEPASRRCDAAAWVTKQPFAVAPSAASQSASVTSPTGLGENPSAAALTSRSRPPSSSAARATSLLARQRQRGRRRLCLPRGRTRLPTGARRRSPSRFALFLP